MNDVSGLGPIERFRVTAKNSLRLYQLGRGAATIDDLVKEVLSEASSTGIDTNSWPYALDGPFDAEARNIIAELRQLDAEWKAAGSPEPPALKQPS